jgi:hypothetical protein
MSTKEKVDVKELCGLFSPKVYHYSIYALTRTKSYVYHGEVREMQIGRCEKVKDFKDGKEIVKAIFSWTKRKGQDRRTLLHFKGRKTLSDLFGCSVPATCCACPVCLLMGGLKLTGNAENPARRIVGRLVYLDAISVEENPFTTVQRNYAMLEHIAPTEKQAEVAATMPFKVEVVKRGIHFPMIMYGQMMSDFEFGMLAYAFLEGLKHYGASGYKGYELIERDAEPLLIVDKYNVPILQPIQFDYTETDLKKVEDAFRRVEEKDMVKDAVVFKRMKGKKALELLVNSATDFCEITKKFDGKTRDVYFKMILDTWKQAAERLKTHGVKE